MKDGKKCILIADDEREIREFLQLLLTAEGYFVVTAEDGLQAQTMAEENIALYLLAVLMGLAAIVAVALERKDKENPKLQSAARILSALALFVGMCNAFCV